MALPLTRLLNAKVLNCHKAKETYCQFKVSARYFVLQPNQKLLRYDRVVWFKQFHKEHLSQYRQSIPKWSLLSRLTNRFYKKLYKNERQIFRQYHPDHLQGNAAQIKNGLKGKKEVSGWHMIKKMLQYVWPKDNNRIKVTVVIALCLLVGSKVTNVAVPFFFKWAVDYLNGTTGNQLNVSDTQSAVVSWATALLIGYGGMRLLASLLKEMQDWVFAEVSQNTIRRIAHKLFVHLHSLDLSFHLATKKGELAKAIDRGSRAIEPVLSALVFRIVPTALEVSLVTGILHYRYGLEFAGVAVACVGFYTLFTLRMTQYRTEFRKQKNMADQEAGNIANDSLVNYSTVKYFNNEKFEAEKYDQALIKFETASLKITKTLSMLNFGQSAIFSIGSLIIMIMSGRGITEGTMTIGDLVMVNSLMLQLSIPLNFLGSIYRDMRMGLTDMENMFNLLEKQPEIKNKLNAPVLAITPTESDITFKDVYFGYTNGQQILNGLSFEVPSGKKVAIVGGSGSGKSTIVRLLFRFYDPQQGTIQINNQTIQDVDLDSLRKGMGIVPQDCVLFHDTVYSNIQYGDLTKSAEEVYEAAKIAELHDLVMVKPLKYETMVGDRGLQLSGGEKQRVAIARAILKDPPIIIYDEATSSLDTITEQNILLALRKITRQRTTIVIAHRLSTVIDADQILVLKNGRVAEKGTHYELLSDSNSLYAELWSKQNQLLLQKEAEKAAETSVKNEKDDRQGL